MALDNYSSGQCDECREVLEPNSAVWCENCRTQADEEIAELTASVAELRKKLVDKTKEVAALMGENARLEQELGESKRLSTMAWG